MPIHDQTSESTPEVATGESFTFPVDTFDKLLAWITAETISCEVLAIEAG